ncbi:hypothetical protein [Sphaerothrix gracilis]|uniref:hypothetical protein n=1 Tax=Sphaerothrix gracilis TaxID=3151835 RepID=UPI0031FD050D
MTPQLEAAIAAIQPLSPIERQQLLQILIQNDLASNSQPNLKALSTEFWQGISLSQLQAVRSPTTVHDLQDLAADFWPAEDSVEEFLAFLQDQRQEKT